MAYGTLEVVLVDAKGLHNTDFLSKMDPYVIFTVKTQEKKSTVAKGQGSEPAWNESFLFTVTDDVLELHLKIMDKDTFSDDDYVGEATISLEPVFIEGIVAPNAYNVVNKDQEYHGEIKIGPRLSWRIGCRKNKKMRRPCGMVLLDSSKAEFEKKIKK